MKPNERLLVLTLMIALVGCSGSDDPAGGASVPDSADGTVKYVAHGLADHQPEVVWRALPASYQQDVNDLVHGFAERMDPEIYDAVFRLLDKTVKVFGAKKEFILQHPMVSGAPLDREVLDNNWDAVVAMLSSVTKSDLNSLKTLRDLDVDHFLATTGHAVMNHLATIMATPEEGGLKEQLAKFKEIEVEVIESTDDTATIEMKIEGEKPKKEKLVRVEGRWIPKEMARDWKEGINAAKEQLEQLDREKIAEMKPQMMAMISAVDKALDELLAAETAEEFNSALEKATKNFMPLFSPRGGGFPPPEPAVEPTS